MLSLLSYGAKNREFGVHCFYVWSELAEFNETKTLFEKPRSELTANYIGGKFG